MIKKNLTGLLILILGCTVFPGCYKVQTDDVGDEIEKLLSQAGRELPDNEYSIAIPDNPRIEEQIRRFTGPRRDFEQNSLNRSAPYRLMILQKIANRDLPPELMAVALQESGFNPSVVSRSGAGGLWQFMPATGRMVKLRHDAFVDERFHPVYSTEKALDYLKELHAEFGAWESAFAAYNWGKGSLARAFQAGGTTDFWELCDKGLVREETEIYVPAIYAHMVIMKNPGAYGFSVPVPEPVLTFELLPLVHLGAVEKAAGFENGILTDFNPHLLSEITTPYERHRTILIPAGGRRKLEALQESGRLDRMPIPEDKLPGIKVRYHNIKQGESLWGIGRKYKTCTQSLMDFNDWKSVPPLSKGMPVKVFVRDGAGK